MIDRGHGSPVLLVPGIQGRWEWMRPAVDALSARCRVLTFSLGDVPTKADCFGAWDDHIDRGLARAGLDAVTIAGVSFGGIIAARYAARRPERVSGLVLVSAPAPHHQVSARQAAYVRRPVLTFPAFAARATARLLPEVVACRPTWPSRIGFLASHLSRVLRYPASPRDMARWAHAWQTMTVRDRTPEPANPGTPEPRNPGTIPTLLVTGEPHLDRVVAVSSTLEYLKLIPGSRHVVLPNTGHIGLVSRPELFAQIVGEFSQEHDADVSRSGRNPRSAAR